jgi:hypothetical protein
MMYLKWVDVLKMLIYREILLFCGDFTMFGDY